MWVLVRFLETYRKHTTLLYNPLCSIIVFCLFPVTLDGPAGRSPCAWLPAEYFSKEVANPVVQFSTPGWFDSLGGRVPCLPKRRTMWYVLTSGLHFVIRKHFNLTAKGQNIPCQLPPGISRPCGFIIIIIFVVFFCFFIVVIIMLLLILLVYITRSSARA